MSMINLLPDDYIERRARTRASMLCLALFGVVMVGVVTAALVARRNGQRTLEVRNRVDASYANAAKLIAEMQELQAQKKRMYTKAETTSSLVERVPRSTLLGIITQALPEDTAMTKFALETRIVRPTQADAGSKKKTKRGAKFDKAKEDATPKAPQTYVVMHVTGLATTNLQVALFMAKLKANPLLIPVDTVDSQEKLVNKVKVREFEVTIKLKPNADAIDVINPRGPQDGEKSERGDRPAGKGVARTETQGGLQ